MTYQDPLTERWVSEVATVVDADYIRLGAADEIPPRIRLSSKGWFETFLKPEFSPYLASSKVRHSVSSARELSPDLLRHEYTVGGYQLVAVESRNFAMLTIHVPGQFRSEENSKAVIHRIAQRVVRMSGEGYELEFKYQDAPALRFWFSTNPQARVGLLSTWHDRVDGFAEPNFVTFIFYKKVEQLAVFQDDKEWFDREFRTKFSRTVHH